MLQIFEIHACVLAFAYPKGPNRPGVSMQTEEAGERAFGAIWKYDTALNEGFLVCFGHACQ